MGSEYIVTTLHLLPGVLLLLLFWMPIFCCCMYAIMESFAGGVVLFVDFNQEMKFETWHPGNSNSIFHHITVENG